MKYSREDQNNLMYKDYILLMAEELNKNGFKDDQGNAYEVSTNVHGDFVSDFSRVFVLSIRDPKAIDFLKQIGLLNNGRCPLTGLMISSATQMTYTSEYGSGIQYDINKKWLEYTKEKKNWGCFISLAVLIIAIIVGIINGFNTSTYVIGGVAVLALILSVMYGMSNFGNNWNKRNLSNEIGINTVTLNYLVKIWNDNSDKGVFRQKAIANEIPIADMNAFENWVNG